jgi:hypothetical protein
MSLKQQVLISINECNMETWLMTCCVGKRLQKQVHKILFLHIYFGCFEEFIYRYEKLRVVQKGKPLQAAEFSLFQSLPCLVQDANHTYHIFFKYKIYLCRGGQRLLLHIMPYL